MAPRKPAADPFADDVETATPEKATTTTVTTTTDAPANSGVTFSHKPSNGYDSALLVFKAATPSELLDLYGDPATKDVIGMAAKVDVYVKDTFREAAPAQTTAAAPNPGAASAGRQAAPEGESRTCKHGQMTYRSGVSATTGKPWKAFMCPTPKGTPDQCAAEWIR